MLWNSSRTLPVLALVRRQSRESPSLLLLPAFSSRHPPLFLVSLILMIVVMPVGRETVTDVLPSSDQL